MKFNIKEDAPPFANVDTSGGRILEYWEIVPDDYLEAGPDLEEVKAALATVEAFAAAVYSWNRARLGLGEK
jgi:hypothetical protein